MAEKTSRVERDQAGHNADAIVGCRASGQDSPDHCHTDRFTYGKTAVRLKKNLVRMTVEADRLGVVVKLNLDTLGKRWRVADEYTLS